MNQIFTDPEKIRGFAHALKGYMTLTQESMENIRMQLSRLGNTWKDREFGRFADEFRSTQSLLGELSHVLENVIPRLNEDAERAAEIHRK